MSESIDGLTGLMRPPAFIEQFEAVIQEGKPFVLVAMDIDHMRALNNTYGHEAGDEWVKITVFRLSQAFTGTRSILGRYGGDEFLAVVLNMGLSEAAEKADALRAGFQIERPEISVSGETVRPGNTISLGLVSFPEQGGDVNDLIDKAMNALRRAKIAGGNKTVVYQELDILTGVLSKAATERALEQVIAARKSDPVSVFNLDIDHFKEINDEHGHRAGDEVLKRLGHILLTNFKDIGIVGRITGDEFAVILPGQRADSAFILADEVRRLVEDSEIQASVGGRSYTLRFRISGGIATIPGDGTEAGELFRKADEALFRSKQIGRNRISLPASAQMVTKTSYYTQVQLEQLAITARKLDKTEAFLLREALDDLLLKYKEVL